MTYLGLDLTDAFAMSPRAIDFAALDEAGHAEFGTFPWTDSGDAGLEASSESRIERCVARVPWAEAVLSVDAPQGLASAGRALRECERRLGAAGKTPDALPIPRSRPFAGFVRTGVLFFAELLRATDLRLAGLDGCSPSSATLFEVYPGAEWTLLAGKRLPKKSSREGREARASIIRRLGVSWNGDFLPSHDQLDAVLSAHLAWRTRFRPGDFELVGEPPIRDPQGIREGWILHARAVARCAEGPLLS